ncbi:tenascin-N-like [Glandiceps talaboti]
MAITQTTIPEPPTKIDVDDYNTTAVELSWEEPDDNVISQYVITYTGTVDPSQNTTSTTTSTVLSDLKPGDTYTITILSQSGDGTEDSVYTDPITQSTIPEPPTKIDVDDYNTTAVELSWEEPDDNVISQYVITYTGTVDPSQNTTSTTTSTVLSDLKPGDTYTITILSQSGDGTEDSVYTDPITQSTIPESPMNVTVTDYSTNTIDVSWIEPADNVIKEYIIIYKDRSKAVLNVTVNAPANSEQLINLTPGDTYTIKIESKSKDGTENSEESDEVSQTTSSPTG